jgi:uncharacterized RDD family membrane protein YckC
MTKSTDNYLPTAGLIRRLAALVYDSLLLFAIALAYSGAILAMRIWVTDTEAAQTPYSGIQGLLFLAGLWFFLGLFYSWCWRRSGQTLGMKTWRLQLVQIDGGRPTWQQCIQRSLLAPLSLALLGIGYLWCLGQSGHSLHDLWTKTRVVVLAKEPAKK